MLSQDEVKKLNQLNPELSTQLYSQIQNLTPLSQEVMSRQPTINIGTIGHVAHGKTTFVEAVTGVQTSKFYSEQYRGCTIQLGYANAKIFKCKICPDPQCYQSYSSSQRDNTSCEICEGEMDLIRHISFIDCPGHLRLMSTMVTGTAVMDSCVLLIDGNQSCPQPQTQEHLAAVEIMQLKNIIILQNKIDLIKKKDKALKNHMDIKAFAKSTNAQNSPIIPISAIKKQNINFALSYIVQYIPLPQREIKCEPEMIIIRSFDCNKPGVEIQNIIGGVIGGTLLKGTIKVGDEIEIRPGIITTRNGQKICKPLFSKVRSLMSEQNQLLYALPGGLVSVGLDLDPSLTTKNALVGNVAGVPGKLPDVYQQIKIKFFLMQTVIGSKRGAKIRILKKGESLQVNIGSQTTGVKIIKINKEEGIIELNLFKPVCIMLKSKVALSRKIQAAWRLIGHGEILDGTQIQIDNCFGPPNLDLN